MNKENKPWFRNVGYPRNGWPGALSWYPSSWQGFTMVILWLIVFFETLLNANALDFSNVKIEDGIPLLVSTIYLLVIVSLCRSKYVHADDTGHLYDISTMPPEKVK